jgi:hypothetical protein
MSYSHDPLLKKIVSKIVRAADSDEVDLPPFADFDPLALKDKGATDWGLETLPQFEAPETAAPEPEREPGATEARTPELQATHEEDNLARDIGVLRSQLESMEEQYSASRAITLQYEGLAQQMVSKRRKLDKMRQKRNRTQERHIDEDTEYAQQRAEASLDSGMARAASMPAGTTGTDLFK